MEHFPQPVSRGRGDRQIAAHEMVRLIPSRPSTILNQLPAHNVPGAGSGRKVEELLIDRVRALPILALA
jgi:hypothetical protein